MFFLWFHFLFPISLLSSNLTFFSNFTLFYDLISLNLISLSFSKWYLSLAASTSAWELKHFCRRRPGRVLGRLPALHPTSAQNSPSSSSPSSSSSLPSGFSFFGIALWGKKNDSRSNSCFLQNEGKWRSALVRLPCPFFLFCGTICRWSSWEWRCHFWPRLLNFWIKIQSSSSKHVPFDHRLPLP